MLHELYPPLVQEWQVVCLKVAWQLRCSPRSPSDFRARNWKIGTGNTRARLAKCSALYIHVISIHLYWYIYIYTCWAYAYQSTSYRNYRPGCTLYLAHTRLCVCFRTSPTMGTWKYREKLGKTLGLAVWPLTSWCACKLHNIWTATHWNDLKHSNIHTDSPILYNYYLTGWWFGTCFIFHNMWANLSHWLPYCSGLLFTA